MAARSAWSQMRLRRTVDDDVQPSGNGRVQVRLRSPEQLASARPSLRARLGRPLPLIGALLVLAALVGYWSVYRATTHRTAVLVAAHDLQAGTVLRPADLRAVELAGDAGTIRSLVRERELGTVVGQRLAVAVPAGAPVPQADVRGAGANPAAFTLVVPALHALGGALHPGDRVTVIATFQQGAGARAQAVARGLRVLAVGQPPTGLDQASATVPVTVALPDPSLAARLALANSDGKIDLLREGGSGGSAPIPPASVQGGS